MKNLILIIATVFISTTLTAQVNGFECYKKVRKSGKSKYNKRRYVVEDQDTVFYYASLNNYYGVSTVLEEARRVFSLNDVSLDLDTDHILSYTYNGFAVDINKTYDLGNGKTARIYIMSDDHEVVFGLF